MAEEHDHRAHAKSRGVFKPAVELVCGCGKTLAPIDPTLGVMPERFTYQGRPVTKDGPIGGPSRHYVEVHERWLPEPGMPYAEVVCKRRNCGQRWVVPVGRSLATAASAALDDGRREVPVTEVGRRLG